MEYRTRPGFVYGITRGFVTGCWARENYARRQHLILTPLIFFMAAAAAYTSNHHFMPEERDPVTRKWVY